MDLTRRTILKTQAAAVAAAAAGVSVPAEAQNIPRKFLTVIMAEMTREGLLISQRGRDGGYELALPPVDIRYGDLIRLTRGSLALVPCAARNAHERCENCLPEAECRLRGLMLTLRDAMAEMLDRMTLADPIATEPPFDEADTSAAG